VHCTNFVQSDKTLIPLLSHVFEIPSNSETNLNECMAIPVNTRRGGRPFSRLVTIISKRKPTQCLTPERSHGAEMCIDREAVAPTWTSQPPRHPLKSHPSGGKYRTLRTWSAGKHAVLRIVDDSDDPIRLNGLITSCSMLCEERNR
jgi:hypothetical protein